MFSRVAPAAFRRAAGRAAARGLSTTAASKGFGVSKGLVAGSITVAGGIVALSQITQQEQAPALCAADFPYTGQPGTAHERSFIVSYTRRHMCGHSCSLWWTCNIVVCGGPQGYITDHDGSVSTQMIPLPGTSCGGNSLGVLGKCGMLMFIGL